MIAAELNEQLWWYVSRSSGFVSWATVTLSVLWGLALSTKLMGKKAPPVWLLSVHRFLGALGIIFIAVHLIGLVGDSYVQFGWAELFVPMASTWQPGAVAWGIVAFYFLIAVEITSLVMKRIPRRFWRWIHFTSFAVYVLATVHAIEAGTDVSNPVFRYAALASVQLVLFMIGLRLVTTRRLKRALRASATTPAGKASADATRQERLEALRHSRQQAKVQTEPTPEITAETPQISAEPAATPEPQATTASVAAVDDALAERLAALKERRAKASAK